MKAIQAADRGGYDALRLVDIPRPQPRAGQALVRVTSAGVTPLDHTVLAGLCRSCLCARIRRCRSRLRAKQLARPGSSQGAPGYPAGYPLAGHDYQPWRMRIKAHAT
jgi:hypothetical protein